jgi:hypothetical protein
MAALLHDHPRPLSATEPVTRFLGLHAVAIERRPLAGLADATENVVAAAPAFPLPDPVPAPRPPLRVIPGGAEAALRRRQAPGVYRRRRLGLVLTLLVVAVASCLGFDLVEGSASAPLVAPAPQTWRGELSADPTPEPPSSPAARGGTDDTWPATYLVQPGDSLWTIAEELAPGTDVRPLVDALAVRAGGGVLEAGTRLDLRGLDR